MFRFFNLFFIGSALFLLVSNPGLDDFITEAQKQGRADQSRVGASWSKFSSAIGLRGAAKAAGVGRYKVCRRSFYVFSAFSVQPESLISEGAPIGAGLGIGSKVFIVKGGEGVSSFLLDTMNNLVGKNLTEESSPSITCTSAHK